MPELFLMYPLSAMYSLLLVRVVFLFAIQFADVDVEEIEELGISVHFWLQGTC